ncbi:MAG: glycosyltransferase family 39 protein [Candidatus Omnitrophota bacterium]
MGFELLRTFAAWIVILPSAFLAGTFFDRLIRTDDSLLCGFLRYALGLATLSYGVVALGAVHGLAPFSLWALLFLPILLRIHKLREWSQWFKDLVGDLFPPAGMLNRVLFVIFAVSFLCLLAGTLTPELGGDALCYQLNLPKVFLRQGTLTPDPLDYNSFFPLLMNNLFLIGLATGGVFAAKLFHFFFGVLLLAAMVRVLKDETRNYALSLFIALVVWTTPTVYNLLSTAYIDVALTFYTFMAVVVFVRALEAGSPRGLFTSGLLIGCGMSIKYLCGISAVALFCVWLYSLAGTRRFRFHFRGAFFFGLGVLAVAGYWLVRNGLVTGNPFFPYWGKFFGVESRPMPDFSSIFGYGTSFFHFLSLYFNMFYSPNDFGTFSGRIGIFYFLFLPFIVLGAIFVPRSRPYGIFWLSFTAVIFFMAQADRWMLPVLPVMALTAGLGIHGLYGYGSGAFKKILKFAGAGTAITILLVYMAAGVYHYRYAYLLFTSKWSPKDYLSSLERTTGVAQWINQNLPADARLLVEGETRIFYFDRPVVRQTFLAWHEKDTGHLLDPETFLNVLRRQKVTHVLIRQPVGDSADFSEVSPEVKNLLRSRQVRQIYSGESQNIREARYQYSIFQLLS